MSTFKTDLDSWLQGLVICVLVDQDQFLGKGGICNGRLFISWDCYICVFAQGDDGPLGTE
jgi:hypothetical protein